MFSAAHGPCAGLIFFVGWPGTIAIMRRIEDGKPANMHTYLGATDEERQWNFKRFKAWVGEDAWIHKRWDAKGDMPGVSKEELAKMKVRY